MSSAYLDIETTGLDLSLENITIIGIYIEDQNGERIIQLVGDQIQASKLKEIFKDINQLFTYNGTQFDLPFIQTKLEIELTEYSQHVDLMHICWQNNLYGGFKKVERSLGIKRELKELDGKEAVSLWYKYINNGDEKALQFLLRYNQEDLTNLKILRQKLLNL